MIQADDFIGPALQRGLRFWTGVPCSFLTPLINAVIEHPRLSYVGATSEGEAVGIALGAHLAGLQTVTLCQNSGLGNAVNPLTSLNYPFRIPTLLIVTHRGAPGLHDEPQHALMGQVTADLLSTLRIPSKPFPEQPDQVEIALDEATRYMAAESLPYAFIMRKGAVAPRALTAQQRTPAAKAARVYGEFSIAAGEWMPRRDAIGLIGGHLREAEALVVATTGKIGRELFDLGHHAGQLYVVGGMGCASAIGLGISLHQQRRQVVVLDGDGAALMKMGSFGTIGHYRPRNLLHIILDNEAHESTGAQATVSPTVDFAAVASACSYGTLFRCDDAASLSHALRAALHAPGPTLIHVKVGISADSSVGRPTLSPVQVKEQFMREAAIGMSHEQ